VDKTEDIPLPCSWALESRMLSFGDREKVLDSKGCPSLFTLFFITGHGFAINFAVSSPPTSFHHQQRYQANTLLILLSVFNFLS